MDVIYMGTHSTVSLFSIQYIVVVVFGDFSPLFALNINTLFLYIIYS